MALPVGDFLVHDHAVKTLLGRLGQQFFRDGNVLLGREAEAIDDALHLHFRVLDLLADLHLLLAGEQRNLAHLVHVHAHRVVQNFQPRILVHFVRLRLLGLFRAFGALGLGLVHDNFHVQAAQFGQHRIEFLRA